MLQKQFISFIEKQNLVQPGQKVLLAVSGGMDSVVMASLFKKAGLNFGIAHCNFNLRGSDSDKDEAFVKKLSEELSVPFYVKTFDTAQQSAKSNESIQMTARRLRYEWLEQVRKKNEYDLIATAHHHDDNIETLIINILRGTGIHGLRGIPLRNRNVIRPLLFATRKEFEEYSEKHNVQYREDRTNKENKYVRNLIRNKVIPIFHEVNPDFRDSLKEFFENIELPYQCFMKYIEEKKKELIIEDHGRFLLPLKKLKQLKHPETVLFESLRSYGFNRATITDIVASFEKQPGKMFYGKEYCLVKDRDCFILFPKKSKTFPENIYIGNEPGSYNLNNIHLKTEVFDITDQLTIPKTEDCAFLDYDKLQFPLKLRQWEQGDIFQPFGMSGKKKVSDFLIDKKVSIDQKENIYVLCSGENIAWITGYRIDERFKIDNSSKCCFYVKFAV